MSEAEDMRACRELVRRRDPVRYRAAMTAPAPMRDGLLTLYALNAEVVRAAWGAREPMLAEIRLQYWHDQLEALLRGDTVDAHPVLSTLARARWLHRLGGEDLAGLIEARRWDTRRESFADAEALWAYLDATGGGLMAMGARIAGMSAPHDREIRRHGRAGALAAFLIAVPALKAHGRRPLPDESPAAIRTLARQALEDLESSRKLGRMAPARPLLLTACEARPVLRRVLQRPGLVLSGGLERSLFRQRLRRLLCALPGRW